MGDIQFTVDQEIQIDDDIFRFAPHPNPRLKSMVHRQEGAAGFVFHLVPDKPERGHRALKVFKQKHRDPSLVRHAEAIEQYKKLPGLEVCDRVVLTPTRHPQLLAQKPDLLYAVLMPWIDGPTWAEIMASGGIPSAASSEDEDHVGVDPLTPEQSLALARSLAYCLMTMEEEPIAHCDLCGANLMLPVFASSSLKSAPTIDFRAYTGKGTARADPPLVLVDMEQVYALGLPRPEYVSTGQVGYTHRVAANGLWSKEADRFAGAILLAEMLSLSDENARSARAGESFFEAEEPQTDCERYHVMLRSLNRWGGKVVSLFEQAWSSDSLKECPEFGKWWLELPEKVPEMKEEGEKSTPDFDELDAFKEGTALWLLHLGDRLTAKPDVRDEAFLVYDKAQTIADSISLPPRRSELHDQARQAIIRLQKMPAKPPVPVPPPIPWPDKHDQETVKPRQARSSVLARFLAIAAGVGIFLALAVLAAQPLLEPLSSQLSRLGGRAALEAVAFGLLFLVIAAIQSWLFHHRLGKTWWLYAIAVTVGGTCGGAVAGLMNVYNASIFGISLVVLRYFVGGATAGALSSATLSLLIRGGSWDRGYWSVWTTATWAMIWSLAGVLRDTLPNSALPAGVIVLLTCALQAVLLRLGNYEF